MYVIPTFIIKTKKTKDEIIYIFRDNTQEIDTELGHQKHLNMINKKFFLGNINGDNFYLKRNNIWKDEIGVKIIDNQVDRSIQYQLGAGDFLRMLAILDLATILGIMYVLEDLLNYSSKITGCIMGLLMVFLFVSLFIQRMNAEKVIKKKFESLFKD